MPDLSDEELDALFRQGAEGYPEELNLGAWARMEQKLDDARIQQLANRKVARLFAAEIGIVAVLLLLWGGYREYQPDNDAPTVAIAASGRAVTPPQGNAASAARLRRTAEAATASQALAVAPGAAATTPSAAGVQANEAPNGTTPAVGPAATAPAGAATRRKGRLLPPAIALAGTTDEPNSAPQTEAGGTGTTHSTTTRRRNRLTTPLLLAAVRSKSATGKAGNAATATPETAAAARPGNAAPSAASQSATAADAAGINPTSSVAPGTASSAAGPVVTGSTRNEGPVKGSTESGGANGTAQAAAGTEATVAATPNDAATGQAPAETTAGTDLAPSTAASNTAAAAAGLTAETLQPVSPALLTDALSQLPTALPADSIVRRRPRPFVPSRLFITGLYAPELSTVRGAGATRVGHSAGIQIEYLLLPRLRLDVGLLSSMKYYRAHPEDYVPARPPMYPIEHIDATCRITDIPVSLRYDAWEGVRYRAFAGAGLSSLLMRDEQYRYIYYSTSSTYTRRVRKGSRHLLSVLNLSAGLERQLTPHWSVQAEPYVKLPLGGVGAGKVRLSSGGVFFGLKYGL